MTQQYSLRDISSRFGGQVSGDENIRISRVSSLGNAKQGDICFINDAKYQKALADCKASAFILRENDAALTSQPVSYTHLDVYKRQRYDAFSMP